MDELLKPNESDQEHLYLIIKRNIIMRNRINFVAICSVSGGFGSLTDWPIFVLNIRSIIMVSFTLDSVAKVAIRVLPSLYFKGVPV